MNIPKVLRVVLMNIPRVLRVVLLGCRGCFTYLVHCLDIYRTFTIDIDIGMQVATCGACSAVCYAGGVLPYM